MSPHKPSCSHDALGRRATRTRRYRVLVDDNFHFTNEDERYQAGSYDIYEDALAKCEEIVEECLQEQLKLGMTADELYSAYMSFGEDPWIPETPDGTPRFSAWDYAHTRSIELCSGPESRRPMRPMSAEEVSDGSFSTIELFIDDDRGYLAWIAENSEGSVLNIQRGLNASDARLHSASCRTITGEPTHGSRWTGPYINVCARFAWELDDWAAENASAPIRRCANCFPVEPRYIGPQMLSSPGGPSFIVTSDPSTCTVQAWSVDRLPFKPTGALAELRAGLRNAVAQLSPRRGEILSASYGSPIPEFCDTENILIYNVGTGAFRVAAAEGLRIERRAMCPPPPEQLDGEALHHVSYEAADRDAGFQFWEERDIAAAWAAVPMPSLTEATKPDVIWAAMSKAEVEIHEHLDSSSYGLRLVLGVPASMTLAPAKILKPLVDGVIASLHAHDGSDLTELTERLADATRDDPKQLGRRLTDESRAVLGKRRLLWPRGRGVQWNPADDLCVALELVAVPSERLNLSGRVFAVHSLEPDSPPWIISTRLHPMHLDDPHQLHPGGSQLTFLTPRPRPYFVTPFVPDRMASGTRMGVCRPAPISEIRCTLQGP